MKNIFTLIILFIVYANVSSQTKISGKVTDNSKLPLPGANIYIKDSYDGGSSDANGNFSFKTDEKGDTLLVISFVGFKPLEKKITLSGADINLEITLEEEATEMGTVVISAGSFEASDENKAVILRPLDIVSTGADADIYSTLETLPGAQQIGETDGLFVRGGSASESKTIIDEMVVQNPFYTSVPDIPSRGRFSPFLFKGTVFSTGGYSAQYGQALSSTLILKTTDLPEQTLSSISLMPIGLGGSHIQKWENSSLSFEGFYSNLDPYFQVQKQRTDWDTAPRGLEFSSNYRLKTSKSGMLKLYSSFGTGDFSLFLDNLDNPSVKDYFKMKSNNFYFNANYRDILGDDWTLFSGVSYSNDMDKLNLSQNNISLTEQLSQAKVTITKKIIGNSFLTFGGEIQNSNFKDQFNEYGQKLNEVLTAGYAETDVFFTNDFAARIGVRGEYSKVLDQSNIAPRISLAYRLGVYNQLNFAFGNFYQTPEKDFLSIAPTTGFELTNFKFEKATHYIFNFQHIGKERTFRIELYYKDYGRLAKGSLTNTYNYFDLPDVPFSNEGKGYAKGIDIFWRDRETIYLTDYWISYSYLDTKREYRNYPSMAYPTFATPHTFSIVAKHWFPTLTTYAGITYTFATGRPYFNPNNPEFLGDKAKSYNNLSLNFSYLTNILGNFTVIFFSVDNIPGFTNVFGYRYSSDGTVKSPIIPPALRMAFVGMFISFGQTFNQ